MEWPGVLGRDLAAPSDPVSPCQTPPLVPRTLGINTPRVQLNSFEVGHSSDVLHLSPLPSPCYGQGVSSTSCESAWPLIQPRVPTTGEFLFS